MTVLASVPDGFIENLNARLIQNQKVTQHPKIKRLCRAPI